ncbi:MAG: hypothetical protein HYY96_00930 [Candidatus Tectomicrobia bacterium]|nr:hypothetical protein [Candidatus Tectomicrobia bacterium]
MFDWGSYLIFAKELVERRDEAAQRSAASRAYYAAFCKARNRLRQKGVIHKEDRIGHTRLWRIYRADPEFATRRIGLNGDHMHEIRKEVDYEDTVVDLPYKVKLEIQMAEELLEQLLSLP